MFSPFQVVAPSRPGERGPDSPVDVEHPAGPPGARTPDPDAVASRPLSALDLGMLGYHRAHPELPLAVGYLLEADGSAPDRESLRNHIAHRVSRAPELTNRIIQRTAGKRGAGGLDWVGDPSFDTANHVFEYRLGVASGPAGLLAAVHRISTQHISLALPPWQVWLISGYTPGEFAVLYRASHVQMDGAALSLAVEWLFGPAGNGAAPTGEPWSRTQRRPGPKVLADAALGSLGWLGRTAQLDALSAPITGEPCYAWAKVDVGRLRTIGQAHGTTMNDVFLAALAGALRTWSPNLVRGSRGGAAGRDAIGSARPKTSGRLRSRRRASQVHIAMPVSTRRAVERGLLSNYVAGVRVGLPWREGSASGRIEGIRRQTARYKRHGNPGAAQRLFLEATPARLRPKALSTGFSSPSVAFTASNIGRLSASLDVLGRPVVAARPLAPLCDGQRLAAVLGGVGETLHVSFIADAGIPHPATLARSFLSELAELERPPVTRPRRPTDRRRRVRRPGPAPDPGRPVDAGGQDPRPARAPHRIPRQSAMAGKDEGFLAGRP